MLRGISASASEGIASQTMVSGNVVCLFPEFLSYGHRLASPSPSVKGSVSLSSERAMPIKQTDGEACESVI